LWVERAQRPLGFTAGRLTIARGDQFFLKLQPFVQRHGGLFALRRQIFYQGIGAVFGGAGASARASITDEPAVEVTHPPSERLDSSSATVANADIFRSFDTYRNAHGWSFHEHCGPIMTVSRAGCGSSWRQRCARSPLAAGSCMPGLNSPANM